MYLYILLSVGICERSSRVAPFHPQTLLAPNLDCFPTVLAGEDMAEVLEPPDADAGSDVSHESSHSGLSDHDADYGDEEPADVENLVPEDTTDQEDVSYLDNGLSDAYWAVAKFNESWSTAWDPGVHIVVDESMIAWRGAGGAHKTYLPRKQTPLGIGLKSTCDGESGIMLFVDLLEGKEVDGKKTHVAKWGASAGCTIRLVEKWAGSSRVVVGDSWFGSV